jgi:HEAT repeat protein
MDIEAYLSGKVMSEPQAQAAATGLGALFQAAGVKQPEAFRGTAGEILDLGKQAVKAALTNPEGDPSDVLKALSQMLEDARGDQLLSAEKEGELRGKPVQATASALIEDAAAEWAAHRLGNAPGGTGLPVVEEEVVRALLRGIKATREPERLLQKLAKVIQEANLPAEIYEHLRQQVLWASLPQKEKRARLLQLQRFDTRDFRRLVDFLQEVMGEGRTDQAVEAAKHYFDVLGRASVAARAEELKRVPEVLQAIAGTQTVELMHALAKRLVSELLDETRMHWECHHQLVNCLSTITQIAGRYEDFEFVHKTALDLKRSAARNPAQHADCCGIALKSLLAPEGIERLVELYLQKRTDPGWAKTVAALLNILGPVGAEIAFRRLEEEAAATNRMQLIRLISRLGPDAIEPTRKRLSDERWYVVRNACLILGELGDPELPGQLRGALRHPEVRVQQAAATAILKSNEGGRAEALSDALPYLQSPVLEMVLDELIFLKDPASVEGVEKLIYEKKPGRAGVLEKAIMVLAAVPSDRAAELLYKVLRDAAQPWTVRKMAMARLRNNSSAAATRLLAQIANLPPSDPLAEELKRILHGQAA